MPHSPIAFHRPVPFVIGVCMLTIGVLLHLPEFVSMRPMGYRMVGMPMSSLMMTGMGLIVGGLVLSTYGLLPPWATSGRRKPAVRYYTQAIDNATMTGAHWSLLFVLGVALVIDTMKPATLGFILPGVRAEYGITTSRAALLPLIALTGTTIGSLIWGVLADRLGRRASILLATLFFVATSICGFMPSFGWNLFMCFMMGLSAGGMLPIVYALMAEVVPARTRGWLVILHGGLGMAGGYLAASGIATIFEPLYTWRILWFFGLPTGLAILILNRWIPESPRFLLEHGREDVARGVMQRFGIDVQTVSVVDGEAGHAAESRSMTSLFRAGLAHHSVAVVLYGLGWGLVNWGFVTFLPTILRDAGVKANASALLFYAALASIPGTIVAAYLYGVWSSRKTMIGFALLTSLSLIAFAALGSDLSRWGSGMLIAVTGLLMVSSTAVVSMLSPYAAEVYPTELRGTGSGLAAASSKIGGIIGPPVIGSMLAVGGGILFPAIVTAIPIGIAAVALVFIGAETRGRGLEQISGRRRPVGPPSIP